MSKITLSSKKIKKEKTSPPALCCSFILLIKFYSKIVQHLRRFFNMWSSNPRLLIPHVHFTKQHPKPTLDGGVMYAWIVFILNYCIFHKAKGRFEVSCCVDLPIWLPPTLSLLEEELQRSLNQISLKHIHGTEVGEKCIKLQVGMIWDILQHVIELAWSLFHAFFQSLILLVFTNMI